MNKPIDPASLAPDSKIQPAVQDGQQPPAEEKRPAGPGPAAAEPASPPRRPWEWRAPETLEQKLARVGKAPNPLLEAAQPLMLALAGMPDKLPVTQAQKPDKATPDEPKPDEAKSGEATPDMSAALALRLLLVEELQGFQQLCERANIRREHVVGAHYLLCTALDEAAHNKAWGGDGWPQHSLLVSLHQDTEGGNKCFLLLGRLLASPDEHLDLIEMFYQILSLGFIGRYVSQTDGHQQLDAIRKRLFSLISSKRGEVPRELSPHWRGEPAGRLRPLRSLPVWVTVSVSALVLFGLFAWFKYQLLVRTHEVEQQILAIGKIAPPEPPRALRLAELLKEEIARGVVSVKEDATRSAVTFRGDDMFGGGRAEVSSKVLPLLDKVAAEINKVTGKVTVIGHSDNVPIRTPKYPSNQALSEERAATVTEYLASKGVAKGRLEAIGKGDTEPLTGNKTPADRAKNRRVEIVVTQ